MDKGPCLLLASAVSPVLIPCLILSGYSIKMTWMNKSCTTLATCHLVAKSYIIIEVAADSVQNAYSPLWALNSWPTRWHQALYPAVVTDHNRSAICPLPLHDLSEFPFLLDEGVRRGGSRLEMVRVLSAPPPPKDPACYMTVVGSVWDQPCQLFNTHNSVHIKDLLQQTEKQSTNTKETENAGSALKVTQYINRSCQWK